MWGAVAFEQPENQIGAGRRALCSRLVRFAFGPKRIQPSRIQSSAPWGRGDGPRSLGRPGTVPPGSGQDGLGAAQIFPEIDDRETAQQLGVETIGDIGAQQQ